MAIHTIPKDSIDRMTSTALSGDLTTAFAVLNQSGLKEDQKAKIAAILKEPRSDMEQRIVGVVGEANIASPAASSQATQVAPSEQIQCISFEDVSTSPFGNAYPCTFGFEGKQYQNATACILAQQYTDQPEIMNLFTPLDPEEATALAEFTPVTNECSRATSDCFTASISLPSKRKRSPHAEHTAKKRKTENPQAELNKDDVLMKVLREKFEQNPDLKKQLLETGTAFLVCQDRGLHLSDNFNGSARNALGTCLMRLRDEFGGTGQVEPPAAYNTAIQSLQARHHSVAVELNSDITGLLFNSYFSKCDFTTITAAACVNKQWNACSTYFWTGVDLKDLKRLCPELTILDAETQGVHCRDEPKINKFQLLKWAREISPHVEGNAGVTYLTMTKGTTLNQLIKIAQDARLTVDVQFNRIIPALGDVPIEQTYGILITNNVFLKSRAKDYDSLKILVKGHGCVMPTVQEYVALCVYTNKLFKKCLYGQNPATFGRSSTHVENLPLVVGSSAPAYLYVDGDSFTIEHYGAGGQRKI